MPSVDEILVSSPLTGLRRVSLGGGDRPVALVRLAERFAELDDAPAGSLVVLSRAASAEVTDYRRLKDVIREKNIVVGVLAVPADSAQRAADDLVAAGVKIVFNYSEALLETPSDVTVHTSNPAVELLHALYFHLA